MKRYLTFSFLFFAAVVFPRLTFCNDTATSLSQPNSSTTHIHDEPDEKNVKHDSFHHAKEEGWPDLFESQGGSDSFHSKFFNMLFILFLLIGFMILASWALKRMMRTKVTQLNRASAIKVLETRTLSPRTTLYLIEVEDKTFLIAESPTHVTQIIDHKS